MRVTRSCSKNHDLFKNFQYVIFIAVCLFLIILFNGSMSKQSQIKFVKERFRLNSVSDDRNPQFHSNIVANYFKRRMDLPTSNLGTFMFKNLPINDMPFTQPQEDKTYKILIWKHWNWLKNRHIYNFGSKKEVNPLEECSVKNCQFTGDDGTISSVDAVVVHVQKGVFPNISLRNPTQRWIFLNDESPKHTFSKPKKPPNLIHLSNMFNWSMTYRSDSDVPVPYGRTMPLKKSILNQITDESLASLVPYWNDKRRDVIASILISDCGHPRRMDYIKTLQKHLNVDIYGKCSKDKKNSCPGHYKSDCNVITVYFFYLAFENAECDEYLTEKLFHNAYGKGAIPVIMGPTVNRCEMLLPPESYLHIDKYNSPEELAKHMIEISKNSSKLLAFHRWRNDFYVANEHAYFGTSSYHLCRICEALNYNDKNVKTYDKESLRMFFDPTLLCR